MRASIALCLALAGCDWTFPSEGGWLPLVGTLDVAGPSLKPTSDEGLAVKYYRAGDGHVWRVAQRYDAVDGSVLEARSFERPTRVRTFKSGTLTTDGIVIVESDFGHATPQQTVRLVSLTDAPDLTLSATNGPYAELVRGPGYFAYGYFDSADNLSRVRVLHDDGTVDTLPADASTIMCQVDATLLDVLDHASPACDARFLPFIAYPSARGEIDSYDLQAHARRRLIPYDPGAFNGQPRFDRTRELVWRCDELGHVFSAGSLATGESHTLPIDCVQLWIQDGQPATVQAADGGVWAVEPDGTSRLLATIAPYTISVTSGDRFVHTPPGSPAYANGATDAWIGDRQVIHAGRDPQFSIDGRKLYWLAEASATMGVGDLHVVDLATFHDRPLVRNVKQYAFLPDGRVAMVADAAIEGPWQRAVVIDEQRGEARLLMSDVDHLIAVGPDLVITRRGDDKVETLVTP